MKSINLLTTAAYLFVLVLGQNLQAQETNGVKITILSQQTINPSINTDVGPVHIRVNLRIKNDGQKDIYIFGSKCDGDFDPLFHLLTFDDNQKQWLFPPFTWEQATADEKETIRLKKGKYFDFYTALSRRKIKKTYKTAIYYAYSKTEKPSLIKSAEFSVESFCMIFMSKTPVNEISYT